MRRRDISREIALNLTEEAEEVAVTREVGHLLTDRRTEGTLARRAILLLDQEALLEAARREEEVTLVEAEAPAAERAIPEMAEVAAEPIPSEP